MPYEISFTKRVEIEELRSLVESELAAWVGAPVTVAHDSDE